MKNSQEFVNKKGYENYDYDPGSEYVTNGET